MSGKSGVVGGNIRIGWKDDESSFLRVPRTVLTEAQVEKLFEIEPGTVDYLVDEFGEVIWPDDWAMKCQNKPWTYCIVLKDEVEVEDVTEDPRYQGGAALVVSHVPLRVTAVDLEAWIRCGLDQDDRDYVNTMARILTTEEEAEKNERRMKRVPQKQFRDVNGHPFSEEIDAQKRHELAEELEEKGENLKKQLAAYVAHCAKVQKLKRRTEDVQLEQTATDDKRGTATWAAVLTSLRALDLSTLAVQKKDWSNVQLCVRDSDLNPRPWSHVVAHMGRQGKDIPDELKELETNMRGVRFSRQRHGHGCYIGEHMEVFDGEWFRDKKHGSGKQFSKFGDFEGTWVDNRIVGPGSVKFTNGDAIKGAFDVNKQHEFSHLDPARYNSGIPQGECAIQFTDGSMYTGEMRDGVVHGEGKYVDAGGDVYVGQFVKGLRHGKGRQITAKGEEWDGEWRDDEPHRYCYHRDRVGGEYLGHWDRGWKAGRVVEKQKNGDRYIGFLQDGMKTGRGKYVYGKVEEEWDHATERLNLKHDHVYEGEWRAGRMRGRGMHQTYDRKRGAVKHTWFTTFAHSETRYPLLMGLQPVADKYERRWRRSGIRAVAEAAAARVKLEKRFKRLFKSQRVIAKKMLREAALALASEQEQMDVEIDTLSRMKERRDRIRHAHAAAKMTMMNQNLDDEDEIGKELDRLQEQKRNMRGIDAARIFSDAARKSGEMARRLNARAARNVQSVDGAMAMLAGPAEHSIAT